MHGKQRKGVVSDSPERRSWIQARARGGHCQGDGRRQRPPATKGYKSLTTGEVGEPGRGLTDTVQYSTSFFGPLRYRKD